MVEFDDSDLQDSLADAKTSLSVSQAQNANNLESAQRSYDEAAESAPISGVITSLSVSENDKFAGGEVLVIQDNSSFIVEASVDEYDIADISKGMSVVIKTDATGDQELDGEVIYVVDTAARSRGNSEGTEETRQDRKSQTTEDSEDTNMSEDRKMLGNSEKPGMPVDGEMPSRGVGATNASIRLQFIMESVVICLLGGFIGIVLGIILGSVAVSVMGYDAQPSIGGLTRES